MTEEIHIAGIVVHARPEAGPAIRAHLALVPRAEIHAAAADGRLVVTLETGSSRRTLDIMDAIRALAGVLDVSLVYQHAETAAAMDEEIEP